MKYSSIAVLGACVGATIVADFAYAQDVAAPQATSGSENSEDSGGIADIVVTAQKRSENIQRVGIAI